MATFINTSTRTGIFTTSLSLTQAPVTTTDSNGITTTTTTASVVADILSWLPDGNYTFVSWTFLPVTETSSSTSTPSETTLATSLSSLSSSTTTSSPAASATAVSHAHSPRSGGAIAGAAIGSVVGVSALAALAYMVLRYRRKRRGGGGAPRPELGGSDQYASEVEGRHILEMKGSEQYLSEMEEKHLVEMGGSSPAFEIGGGSPGDQGPKGVTWAMHDVKGHGRSQTPAELDS
ncbi:hypothetical protein GGR56DRAFT_628102 [Xylariaceae sp. FL0804]|nr:hypothetical protein GGR56DRAFT_628102 [Xylariaceae sp. FL0804]